MAAILVVEDERVVADDIQESLKKLGYEVIGTAANAEQCLALATARRPDLVLMDVRIQGELDGIEAARQLRARFDVPVIYLTAFADEQTVARACETEPHGYIQKPFRASELKSAVEIALAKHQHEQQRARKTLFDRLNSLGTLAAGVAHEINNPLTYILGNASLTERDLQALRGSLLAGKASAEALVQESIERIGPMIESMLEIADGAERIRRIVGDLQVFARPETAAAHGDARAALEWALRVTEEQVRPRARVETRFVPLPPVRGSGARLGQVFANLLTNAAQSIEGPPEQNTIVITTAVDERGWAVVTIADSGRGMSSDVKKRMFEPFFSTQPIGGGSGLGLSICHGIVESLGGRIDVDSAPNEGTRVSVHLPLPDPEPESVRREPTLAPSSARARVLIIDDEPQVARTMQRMLRAHEVTIENSALAALERLNADSRFDLIFCDLTMPDLSGMEFYERLSTQVPALTERVVFVSGGVFTTRAADFLASVPNLRLPKPFQPAELRRFVDGFLRDHARQ
jgi:two-component system cell cycle sensor histidine kinase/response regulator CckA